MNEVLLRVITAQISQGATDEAVRQISSGTVSGDWVVWTFPCMESKLKDVLWSQSDIQPNFEERFENLKQYALKDRKDAELYLSNPILRRYAWNGACCEPKSRISCDTHFVIKAPLPNFFVYIIPW